MELSLDNESKKQSKKVCNHSDEIISRNIELLKHGLEGKDAQMKSKAAAKAFKYSSVEKYATAMSSAGLPRILVLCLLEGNTLDVQENATGAIGNIACFGNNGTHVIESGAVPILIRMLGSDACTLREHAAGAIGNLGNSDDDRKTLFDSGCIPPLVRLLKDETDAVQENAVWAISALVSHPRQCVTVLYEHGAIPVLVQLLSSPSLAAQAYASKTLCHMSLTYVFRDNIVDTGVIPVLLDLLRSPSVSTRSYAAALVSNLAWDYKIRASYMAEIDTQEKVLESLIRIINEGIQAHERKMSNLSEGSVEARRDSVEEQRLSLMLDAAEHACQGISNIALTHDFRDRIMLFDGLGPLTICLTLDDISGFSCSRIRTAASSAIANLARSYHLMERLHACGATVALADLLQRAVANMGHSGVIDYSMLGEVEHCVEALGNLAFSDSLRTAIWRSDTLPRFVLILDRSVIDAEVMYASGALKASPPSHMASRVIGSGGNESSSSSSSVSILRVLEATVIALSHLSFLPSFRIDLYHCGGVIAKLIIILRAPYTSIKCKEHASVILGNLATIPTLQENTVECRRIMEALQYVSKSNTGAQNGAYDASMNALTLYEAVCGGPLPASSYEQWSSWVWDTLATYVIPFVPPVKPLIQPPSSLPPPPSTS